MPVRLGEYNHQTFQDLPWAEDAFVEVDNNPLSEDAIEDLRSVYHKHDVSEQYGLSILHRHVDLDAEEQIIEYQNVSTPWKMPRGFADIGGKVRPKAWTLSDEIVRPLEFAYSDPMEEARELELLPSSAFLGDLRDALTKHGLESRYGLSRLPADAHDETKPAMLEFTAGRTSVLIPMTTQKLHTLAKTLWLFPCIDPLVDSAHLSPRMRHCYMCYRC